MALTNFRASDFDKRKDSVKAVRSKRDAYTEPKPTTQPVVAPDADPNAVPAGTVPEVLTWVGDDKEKAQKALDAENENDKPRKGLVSELDAILAKEDESEEPEVEEEADADADADEADDDSEESDEK